MPTPSNEELDLQLQVSGFCVLEEVIPADACAGIRCSIVETVARESCHYEVAQNAAKTGVGFIPSVINHDQSFAEYLADRRLLKLAERILGDHVRISFTSAIINQQDNDRGHWHADWPFNQNNAGHVPAPYPDAVMHLTTLWMLSPFDAQSGGTLLVPGSHRCPTNPTAPSGPDPLTRFPQEVHATGPAGSVLVFDSRLWHATASNRSQEPRVALAVRYAPWWLNLDVLRPDSEERRRMCDEMGATENCVPLIQRSVFDRLPDCVRPLYRHWVEQ